MVVFGGKCPTRSLAKAFDTTARILRVAIKRALRQLLLGGRSRAGGSLAQRRRQLAPLDRRQSHDRTA